MNWESKCFVLRKTVAFIVYACGVWVMQHFYWKHLDSPYRYWLFLLPTLPMIYLIATIIRQISGLDEMWKKIVTESLAFSALATIWTCCSFFFIRAVDAPVIQAEWVFFMLIAYYLTGFFFSWRRYK